MWKVPDQPGLQCDTLSQNKSNKTEKKIQLDCIHKVIEIKCEKYPNALLKIYILFCE